MLLLQLANGWRWASRWLHEGPHAALQREIERDPRFLGFLVWPYVHAGWPAPRRLEAISEHLRIVEERFPWLALSEGGRRELLRLDALAPGLRLEVDRAPWFLREGGLVLNVFLDEHRLMSAAFSLAHERGDLVAYVGGLQGSNRPDALDTFRQLTRTLHGLRPRDFTVKSFQLFAAALGVVRVLCVADEFRHHRHPFFGGSHAGKLFLSYDEVWREHGGRLLPSGFFELGPVPAQKRLEEVPSRKRAMYRRRVEMMAALGARLSDTVEVAAGAAPVRAEASAATAPPDVAVAAPVRIPVARPA